MNGSDERLDAPADPAFEEMRSELDSQRTMLSICLVCLILLGLTMDRYLLKQVRNVRQQIDSIQQLEKGFRFDFARASEFWSSLVVYSKTHPDFVPIVNYWSPALNQTMISNTAPRKQ